MYLDLTMSKEEDKLFERLKYPGSKNWRDTNTIKNGCWPNGAIARISDPEFQPSLDEHHRRIETDLEYREEWLKRVFPERYKEYVKKSK